MPESLFPLGGPVAPAEAVGRGPLVAEIAGWLADGFRVVLTGPPRCGKSTIALAVGSHLRESGMPVAFCDLSSAATLRDAAVQVVRACAELAGGGVPGDAPATEEAETALLQALDLPERIAEAAGVHACALVIDGCEQLERMGDSGVVAAIRGVLRSHARTGYLFAGVHGPGLARLTGTRAVPFALPIGVLPPPPEAWEPYLRSRFSDAGVQLAESGLARLLARTGGHPFDLMAVCREAMRTRGRRARPVDRAEVELRVRTVRELLDPLCAAEVAALGPVAAGVLRRLAQGRHIYREAGPPATIKRAVDALVAGGFLVRTARGAYGFTEPLLEEALRIRTDAR